MEILLEELTLINFKGQKKLVIPIQKDGVTISGKNETGKTTIYDAFLWLLFDKNSSGLSDFNVKPLNSNGKTTDKLETEVSATCTFNGSKNVLKKTLREIWRRKRGELTPTFDGNEKIYTWNDTPIKAGEYQQKINDLIDEKIFKLITNTSYFNSLAWTERRQVLMNLAGAIPDDQLFEKIDDPLFRSEIEALKNGLELHKSVAKYKASINAKKAKLKEELDYIPSRIDEVTKGTPKALAWDDIEWNIKRYQEKIDFIDNSIADTSKAHEALLKQIQEQNRDIHGLKMRKDNLENSLRIKLNSDANSAINSLSIRKSELVNLQQLVVMKNKSIERLKSDMAAIVTNQVMLRERWTAKNKEEIKLDDLQTKCPTCGQDLPADNIEEKKKEMIKNFTTEKTNQLSGITSRGKAMEQERLTYLASVEREQKAVVETTEVINKLSKDIAEMEKTKAEPVQSYEETLARDSEYHSIVEEIKKKESELIKAPETNIDVLKREKAGLYEKINEWKVELNTREQIVKAGDRIAELEASTTNLSQQIADLEKSEFLIDKFVKAKIDTVTERINGKFKYVTFRMFDQQINGAIVECCDVMIKGVPFPDANHAAQINAGLDIIDTLSLHYNVRAPVFADNAEAVNELLPVESQMIRLVVTNDPKLVISPL